MANIDRVLDRTAATADLAVWTLISPATAVANQDRLIVNNDSTQSLRICLPADGDAVPSGTDTTDGDFTVAPQSFGEILVGPSQPVYGLHYTTPLAAGYVVLVAQ